jgi:hypothetical protein
MSTNAIALEYNVHLDNKNRFALRGTTARHYAVHVFKDNHVLLSPQKLVADRPISAATLRQISRSVKSLKFGKTAGTVDVRAARRLFER